MTPTYPWLFTYVGPLLAVVVVLLAVMVGLLIGLALRLRRVENSYRRLTAGTNAGNLDAVLEDQSGNAYVDDGEQPSAFRIGGSRS